MSCSVDIILCSPRNRRPIWRRLLIFIIIYWSLFIFLTYEIVIYYKTASVIKDPILATVFTYLFFLYVFFFHFATCFYESEGNSYEIIPNISNSA